MTIRTKMRLCAVGLALVAACGSAGTTTTGGAATPAATMNSEQAVPTTTLSTSDESIEKVSANAATVDEIAAALAAAGVDNADRWAREVAEYRPYDTSDLNLTHLQEELAKYNPAPGVVDLIVSVLEP